LFGQFRRQTDPHVVAAVVMGPFLARPDRWPEAGHQPVGCIRRRELGG
jgi:hypothetical protein